MVMQINHPALVEDGKIVQPEMIEHLTCPNCDADISQEEIDAKHCNACNTDYLWISKKYQVF